MPDIPRVLFEVEDLIALENRVGAPLKYNDQVVSLTDHEFEALLGLMEESGENSLEEDPERALKGLLIRASSRILLYARRASTDSDKAALLSAMLSLASLDPSIAYRVMSIARI